jgi:tetratricopeptide (TPR) repeat protein
MTAASQRAPGDPFIYEQLGLIYSVMVHEGQPERMDDAVRSFRRAAQLNPYWSLHQANLGTVLRSQGDLDGARQAFSQAAALAPAWYAYWLELAEVEELRGDADAATAAYQQAAALAPDWFPVEYWQGSPIRAAVYQQWQSSMPPPPTIAQLEAQYAVDPSDYASLYRLVKAYQASGDWTQVESLLARRSLLPPASVQQTLELQWIEAELAAQRGAYADAVRLGEDVLTNTASQACMGPVLGATVIGNCITANRASGWRWFHKAKAWNFQPGRSRSSSGRQSCHDRLGFQFANLASESVL